MSQKKDRAHYLIQLASGAQFAQSGRRFTSRKPRSVRRGVYTRRLSARGGGRGGGFCACARDEGNLTYQLGPERCCPRAGLVPPAGLWPHAAAAAASQVWEIRRGLHPRARELSKYLLLLLLFIFLLSTSSSLSSRTALYWWQWIFPLHFFISHRENRRDLFLIGYAGENRVLIYRLKKDFFFIRGCRCVTFFVRYLFHIYHAPYKIETSYT